MQRFIATIQVSYIANGQDDAEHLARLIRDRMASLMGNGQATAQVVRVEPHKSA